VKEDAREGSRPETLGKAGVLRPEDEREKSNKNKVPLRRLRRGSAALIGKTEELDIRADRFARGAKRRD